MSCAQGHPDPDDDVLLAELSAVIEQDLDPPSDVLHAARASYTWRTVDAELAALTFDSLLDDAAPGTRSTASPRLLAFEAGPLTIEVEVDRVDDVHRIVGQVLPPGAAEIDLLCDGSVKGVAGADAMGRFVAQAPGSCRLLAVRCRFEDGTVVVTAHAPL